jgi:drug/metabolite transporter (DMT)-like permease
MTGLVLSRRQVWLLVFVTLFWGVNWPIMKSAVSAYPAMAFRAWSMVLGLPCLWLGLKLLRVPLQVPRRYWAELLLLATTNMVAWHLCLMWALPGLSSGRAAIIGYTMPVFSALWGMLLYRQRLSRPQWVGVGSATAGVVLLLWHEFSRLSGVPLAGLTLLAGTAVWALGTQQLRRSAMDVPVLAIGFWMTAITTAVVLVYLGIADGLPASRPSPSVWVAVAYNALLIFGFCHVAWFSLARALPPVASSVSISLIPVLGLLSGALWLNETLHWQDGVAVLLIMLAIGVALYPGESDAS